MVSCTLLQGILKGTLLGREAEFRGYIFTLAAIIVTFSREKKISLLGSNP